MQKLLFVIAILPISGLADDVSDRERLIGAWRAEEAGSTLKIENKGPDVLHVTQSLGDQRILEFECSTRGGECEVKDSGKSTKVSIWFNGAKLVALETKGKKVVKHRFGVGEADMLEVDLIPIEPQGKTETARFRRSKQ